MEAQLAYRSKADLRKTPYRLEPNATNISATGEPSSRSFPFFNLPPELREAVLRYLVLFPYPPQFGTRRVPILHRSKHENAMWAESRGELYPMSLLLTSKQMREEAYRAWRIFNTFVWVVRTSRSNLVRIEPLEGRELAEMMQVRRLVVRIVQIDNVAHLERDLFPSLLGLVERGNLRHLEFEMDVNFHAKDILDIFFPSYRPHKKLHQRGDWDIHDYTPNAAMTTLLELLSHPRLESAALRIDLCQPEHPASRWCPLHDFVAESAPSCYWGVSIKWREFRAACSRDRSEVEEVR